MESRWDSGSARVPRARLGVAPERFVKPFSIPGSLWDEFFGATPKTTRQRRVLPETSHGDGGKGTAQHHGKGRARGGKDGKREEEANLDLSLQCEKLPTQKSYSMKTHSLSFRKIAFGLLALAFGLSVGLKTEAGSFTNTGSMMTARGGHMAILLNNGKVLVIGGDGRNSDEPMTSAELYNPTTKSWTVASPQLLIQLQ